MMFWAIVLGSASLLSAVIVGMEIIEKKDMLRITFGLLTALGLAFLSYLSFVDALRGSPRSEYQLQIGAVYEVNSLYIVNEVEYVLLRKEGEREPRLYRLKQALPSDSRYIKVSGYYKTLEPTNPPKD